MAVEPTLQLFKRGVVPFSRTYTHTRQRELGIGDRLERNCPPAIFLVHFLACEFPHAFARARNGTLLTTRANKCANSFCVRFALFPAPLLACARRISARSRVRALAVPSQLAKLLFFKMIRSHGLARKIARLTDHKCKKSYASARERRTLRFFA